MTEYRIDDLARLAGTTVRNVRAYQERGLLSPPRRVGRAGVFDDGHMDRLRLIGQMLDRGYTLANIGEMLAAWENGHVLEEVLGSTPPSAIPSHVTLDWLIEAFGARPDGGGEAATALQAALDLGVLEPDGERFRVTNPRLLRAASELAAAGIPLDALAEHGRALRRDVERIASRFVDLVQVHVFEPHADGLPGPDEAARLTELAQRLRSLADLAVLGELGQAIDHETRKRLAAHLQLLLQASV